MPMTSGDKLCLIILIIVNLQCPRLPDPGGLGNGLRLFTFHEVRPDSYQKSFFGSLVVDVCRHRDSCCSRLCWWTTEND